ncbi:MAG: TPM domain-containing protein [Deltaproteobacteria bacterium]|nr:TPM domain-containing protein [Deltaproteobacteria bacterium]
MHIARSRDPYLFLSHEEKTRVVQAIQAAERATSGEIRLHLERKIPGDPLAHARSIFEHIGMTKTAARNGVLILLGVASHRVVILGDQGIHECVPERFWDSVMEAMIRHFQHDAFADGLVEGIGLIGSRLCAVFPCQRDDLNELPDEISYSR